MPCSVQYSGTRHIMPCSGGLQDVTEHSIECIVLGERVHVIEAYAAVRLARHGKIREHASRHEAITVCQVAPSFYRRLLPPRGLADPRLKVSRSHRNNTVTELWIKRTYGYGLA